MLELGIALKMYKNLTNKSKLKIRKFQGHILAFREVTRENLEDAGEGWCVGGRFD